MQRLQDLSPSLVGFASEVRPVQEEDVEGREGEWYRTAPSLQRHRPPRRKPRAQAVEVARAPLACNQFAIEHDSPRSERFWE